VPRMTERSINFRWFKPFGWIYRPISWQGWTLLLFAIAFCYQVFCAIDRHSHSASDTLYGVFPYFVCAGGVLNWIASKTAYSESVDRSA
jgi:hypothetical protein